MLGCLALAFSVAFSKLDYIPTQFQDGWKKTIFEVVTFYILFIFARTLFHLVFSCANQFTHPLYKPMKSFPMVSILVPCFNEEDVVKKALKSVLAIDYPNFEVLLIDDGSSDSTLEIAKEVATEEQKHRIRLIHKKNAGKAAALNRGIEEALGEFVLCMDADSLMQSDVLRQGVFHFENRPELAAVAGNVRVGNRGNFLLTFQRLEYITGLNFIKEAQSFLHMVMIVPGPIGLFRTSAIKKIGGYKTDTFAEDADLTVRLLTHGYKIIYEPRMIAVTEAPREFQPLISQRYRWTRGTLQTIKLNSYWLFHFWKNFRNFFIISYLSIETVLIPIMNFILAMTAIEYAILRGDLQNLGYLFIQLTLLDLLLAIYSMISEKNGFSMVAISIINRLTYALGMEVLRFFATIEEIFALPMNWGKLKREGL